MLPFSMILSDRELHWLDVADRVTYKLGVTVCKCLHGQAPDYLSELCTPVVQVAERQRLRSAMFHGFSSIRTAVAPSLSLEKRHGTCYLFKNNLRKPDMQIDCFRRTLKTCLFDPYSAH